MNFLEGLSEGLLRRYGLDVSLDDVPLCREFPPDLLHEPRLVLRLDGGFRVPHHSEAALVVGLTRGGSRGRFRLRGLVVHLGDYGLAPRLLELLVGLVLQPPSRRRPRESIGLSARRVQGGILAGHPQYFCQDRHRVRLALQGLGSQLGREVRNNFK